MKIGIDIRPLETDTITGIGEYIKNLILGLSKKGFRCILYHTKKYPNIPSEKNIETRLIKSQNKYFFEQVNLLKELSLNPPDIYHATSNMGIPLLHKGISVLTVHDLIPLTKKNYFNKSAFPFLSKKTFLASTKIATHKAKRIIAISKTTKKNIIEKLDIKKNKIRVIYPGASIPQNPNFKIIDKLNLKKKQFILNNGGIDKRKNLERLIKSVDIAKKVFPNIKLVITGENIPQRKGLEELAQKIGIKENIIFTGFIDRESLWALIQESEFVCYPSEDEGFGFPIIEAVESSKAIILSRISIFKELAKDFALFVNPNSPLSIARGIIRLKKDKNLKKFLIKKSLTKKGLFSWEKTINKTISLYKEII